MRALSHSPFLLPPFPLSPSFLLFSLFPPLPLLPFLSLHPLSLRPSSPSSLQLRDVYLEGQSKRYELKMSVLSKADEMISKHPEFKRQGHLMVHEKKGKGMSVCVEGGLEGGRAMGDLCVC